MSGPHLSPTLTLGPSLLLGADPSAVVPWSGTSILPALTNATLTQVTAAGQPADYDRDATAGTLKFTGTAYVFLHLEEDRVDTGGESNVLLHRQVLVGTDVPVAWAQNDVLTLTYGGQTVTGTAQVVKTTEPGLNLPGVVRVTLDDA